MSGDTYLGDSAAFVAALTAKVQAAIVAGTIGKKNRTR